MSETCQFIGATTRCAASKRLRKSGALCPLRALIGARCEPCITSRDRREAAMRRARARSVLAVATAIGRWP